MDVQGLGTCRSFEPRSFEPLIFPNKKSEQDRVRTEFGARSW